MPIKVPRPDMSDRRVRDLPVFEYRVELIVPRVRVACPRCGPKLERLPWLDAYARAAGTLHGMSDLTKLHRASRVFLARLLIVHGTDALEVLRQLADELDQLEAEWAAELPDGASHPPD